MSDNLQQKYVELIQAHEGIIHKLIGLYVDNEEDRKDLKQEIMLQAWHSFKNFKGQSKFSTWLYKVSLNTVLNFRKKEAKKAQLENDSLNKTTDSNKDDHEVLYSLIKQMNEIDKMLMTLHFEGYKNIEIADITGMTQNHINVKLHRLKQQLIEQFKALQNG